MSNELSVLQTKETKVIAFGRVLHTDSLNTVEQIDDSTVIIKPRYNTTGLRELKVL